MDERGLKALVQQGLEALQGGSQVAQRATGEIQGDASHPDLRQALQRGEQQSRQWDERIARAARDAGGGQGRDNPVLEAVYEVSKRIRQQTQDPMGRDLGIIASGQIALHYWMAGFGTLRTYAGHLGMRQVAEDMQACLEEAKRADAQHTELALRLMGAEATAK